jgi:geranylgeranyl reductase family protein
MHVAVVGAGPAGAWAAYTLARRGARVTIFDDSHPREKPCGGGVTGRALALVSDALDARLDRVAIRTARFTDVRRGVDAVVPLGPDALAVTSRAAFDAALLTAAVRAGAVLHASRVVGLRVDASSVEIQTRDGAHRPDFLVGADGANSVVRKRVTAPFRRGQLSVATGFFARGVTSDEIVIEMVSEPAGYLWSFPRTDHLAIGICAQAGNATRADALRARAAAWIRAARLGEGATLVPYSWPIPSLAPADFDEQVVGGARWCLVGDAAGLVDPITREGIYFAIASGGWAAEAIANGGDVAHAYTTRVNDEAVGELARAARLKAGFFRPVFTTLMMDALCQSAAVRGVMADLVAGTQSYRSLKWRLLRTLEPGLAWRAIRVGTRGCALES